MKKYLVGLGLLSVSLFVDTTPLIKALETINKVREVHAAEGFFGRAPLMEGQCETGMGFCIDK